MPPTSSTGHEAMTVEDRVDGADRRALQVRTTMSLKEIAAVRVISGRTIRAQARSIYPKAGLSGRAAVSAFFLEDLLAPIEHVN